MPDPVPSSSRLEDLRMRWQLDPASRVYLQLAEEYRKLDRHPEAIEVLKRGLQQRPNDLSAQVALGRCHLEMDEIEPALRLLEGVIERDPAHMVGNKLLLEVYLKSGEAGRAGERLELYKLLNPADPEIDTLETRLRSLRGAASGVPDPGTLTTAAIPIVPRDRTTPSGGIGGGFSAPSGGIGGGFSATPAPPEPPAEEIFELPDEPEIDDVTQPVFEVERAAAAPARDPAFETSPAFELPFRAAEPPLIDEALIGEEAIAETPLDEIPLTGPAFELVPDEPASAMADGETELPESEPAWDTVLGPGEIFYLGPPPPPPRFEELWGWPVPAQVLESQPAVETWTDEPALEEPEPALAEPLTEEAPWAAEEPVEEAAVWTAEEPDLEAPSVEPAFEVEAPVFDADEVVTAPEPVAPELSAPTFQTQEVPPEETATATLGSLYLRQGHVSEAEKIFRQVLRRDPRNSAALAGLARIRGETGLTAQVLLASAGEQIPVGLTEKKVRLLESYLTHLRGASEPHVH